MYLSGFTHYLSGTLRYLWGISVFLGGTLMFLRDTGMFLAGTYHVPVRAISCTYQGKITLNPISFRKQDTHYVRQMLLVRAALKTKR